MVSMYGIIVRIALALILVVAALSAYIIFLLFNEFFSSIFV